MITADILGERARLTPNATALVYIPTGERFTYARLNERAVLCARFWRDRCGLQRGDRVGLLAHNRVEFLDAYFAAAKSGIILVPLSTRQTPHELEYILRDCAMSTLMYDAELAETVAALKKSSTLTHWVALDGAADASELSYADEISRLAHRDWQGPRLDPEDVLYLLYTSGTTGKPKGVMVPHRMVAWNGYNTVIAWQLRADDVSPIFTPLYHAGGLGAFLVPIFTIGGTVVLHRAFDAKEIWQTIEKEKCTVVLGVPTIYKLLMEAPEFQSINLSHVRWLISGGAPLPLYIIEAYQKRGVVFKQGYGLTEVGVNCFSMTVEESVCKAGSIGKPMLFTEAKLVDANGKGVATGEVGELWLRGPHVCTGYWKNAEATAAALDSEGWFHTGDQARCDAEGFFFIAGRTKDMLISGGVNVYPAEIEAELLLHPGVQDAAVIGAPHSTWGEMGIAFVVARSGQNPSSPDLADFLGKRLAKYKIPREFIFVPSLPRTPYGKVVKAELQRSYEQMQKK